MERIHMTPLLNQIDFIVEDVKGATAFLRDALGLSPVVDEERFAQFDLGAMTVMFSPDALVPMEPAQGVILHFQVPDVAHALEQAQRHGAKLLWGPKTTDWYTESAIIEGPGGIRIDLYRPVEP